MRGLTRGGGSPVVASFPSPCPWGLVSGLARGTHAGPRGGTLPIGRLGAGVPPVPGVHWLASRARSGVCLGVQGMQTPFGWPCRPLPGDTQIFIQIHSVCCNKSPLYSNVRTAAMFGCSTVPGLSSISAQHEDNIQSFTRLPHPAAPHAHAPTPVQGPRSGELATARGSGKTNVVR